MPALKGKRKKLSTDESIESCFVTKIRWPVESVHSVLKQKYHLLDQKIDNKLIPNIGLYFRIAPFLNNIFGKSLQSNINTFDDILQRMHSQRNVQNILATEVEEKGRVRRKLSFKSATSDDILDFSEMTERDLKHLVHWNIPTCSSCVIFGGNGRYLW